MLQSAENASRPMQCCTSMYWLSSRPTKCFLAYLHHTYKADITDEACSRGVMDSQLKFNCYAPILPSLPLFPPFHFPLFPARESGGVLQLLSGCGQCLTDKRCWLLFKLKILRLTCILGRSWWQTAADYWQCEMKYKIMESLPYLNWNAVPIAKVFTRMPFWNAVLGRSGPKPSV